MQAGFDFLSGFQITGVEGFVQSCGLFGQNIRGDRNTARAAHAAMAKGERIISANLREIFTIGEGVMFRDTREIPARILNANNVR